MLKRAMGVPWMAAGLMDKRGRPRGLMAAWMEGCWVGADGLAVVPRARARARGAKSRARARLTVGGAGRRGGGYQREWFYFSALAGGRGNGPLLKRRGGRTQGRRCMMGVNGTG